LTPKLPDWIRMKIPSGEAFGKVRRELGRRGLSTVCEEARCPNRGECWGHGTATFMLMGDLCTRRCRFCAVSHAPEGEALVPPDPCEAGRIVEAVSALDLRYVVLTSVTRDDLPDGGAGHIAAVVGALVGGVPGVRVEALVPDLPLEHLRGVAASGLFVLAHNIEVVRRLTPAVRDARADYGRSLRLLGEAKRLGRDLLTKSSILLGLGETRDEIVEAMGDLRRERVDLLTLGQYLRPTRRHVPVERYLPPGEWDELRGIGESMGFRKVFSGPLVRSSYLAGEMLAARGADAPPARQGRP
jgi:lipoic acid synthetase